jgi:hypothetical protein
MKTLTMAVIVAIGIGGAAVAQQHTTRDRMYELRTKHGETFEQCRDLAVARGWRLDDDDIDHSVMMFIEGCIMGKQR